MLKKLKKEERIEKYPIGINLQAIKTETNKYHGKAQKKKTTNK